MLALTSDGEFDSHACGTTAAGEALCWGNNSTGELGVGDMLWRVSPTNVHGDYVWEGVTAGRDHSCGWTLDGRAFCWGNDNAIGALGGGSGPRGILTNPILVVGGHTWTALDAGFSITCGITIEAAAYCWGSNGSGTLGAGLTGTFSTSPVRVIDPLDS
jgi:alpha-tubulin suppressor-like RCC1 family protein